MAGPLSKRGSRRSSVGKLRHRVTIQRLDESVRDAARQVVPTWFDVDTVWASVEPVGGKEVFASGQVQANATHRVEMRHRSDLTAKDRLIWVTNQNQLLNIVAVKPSVGQAANLEILCVREET